MDNNVTTITTATTISTTSTTTTTTGTTIEHCSAKGFPPSSPPPLPPDDLINNNPSTKHHGKSFGTTIISNVSDLQNNELKCCPVSSVVTSNNDECPESVGSMPDADLTECLATATEALTEILVKTSCGLDTNGNDSSSPLPLKHHPNVSSSSTQTECPPSSSFHHVCCCKEWNCWKLSSSSSSSVDGKKDQRCITNGSSVTTGTMVVVQCQSTSRCCHHRKKKFLGNETSYQDKIRQCGCNTVTTKYSKSWRELRKLNNNRRANMQICRFQSCNNRSSKLSM